MKAETGEPAYLEAVKFLEHLRRGGPWVLTGIVPDGKTRTIAVQNADAIRSFIQDNDGRQNLYFSVNPTRKAMTSKAAKFDIAAVEYVFADLDPKDDETPEAAKLRYLAAIAEHTPKPTAIIESGNGIQALWRLDERIELAEPVIANDENGKPKRDENGKVIWEFPPETANAVADIEARGAALMKRLGSAAGTQNIDRILRLPGTTNLPNKAKIEKGRTACKSKLLSLSDATCKSEDFPLPSTGVTVITEAKITIDWAKVEVHAGWIKTVADLPGDFSAKARMIIAHTGNLRELNIDLMEADAIHKAYGSWSDVTFALATIFKADGRFTAEQIAAALTCDLQCNRHITKLKGDQQRRAVERSLSRSYNPPTKSFVHVLNWRECKANGMPLPSMHNARLAITALDIECRYDVFHNKIIFGFRGDSLQHEMQAMLGEVTDNAIICLRQIMSDRFGFDLGDKATRDAVVSLALEHCFNPVCDMLDKAESDYDGVERLDKMAITYFNCDDTPLNRAIVRKTMIAAVRRARRPGVKFDTITVLESEEGWNKSSAWRLIAGDENFSDASILAHNVREVQEQLSEVWIHENADLAGMKKAEVESVKAFASRQSDDARPAYGHFIKKQKRHSIEVGTTNSSEYLQSQTGNRRFWPLTIRKMIDIDLLKRDRMLLLGEAAKYESAGESITLDENLWPASREEQEKRRVKDSWEDIVADMPRHVCYSFQSNRIVFLKEGEEEHDGCIPIIHKDSEREIVASADVLKYVLGIPIDRQKPSDSMRLANVMKRAGWERSESNKVTINGKQVRGYFRRTSASLPLSGDDTPECTRLETRKP